MRFLLFFGLLSPSLFAQIQCRKITATVWSPFISASGVQLGKPGHGLNSQAECEALVSNLKTMACNWNGLNYSAYDLNNKSVGQDSYSDPKDCRSAIDKIKNGLSCNLVDGTWSMYRMDKTRIGNGGFDDVADCWAAINRSSPYFVCSNADSQWAPYYIEKNERLGKIGRYFNLSYCMLGTVGKNHISCSWNGYNWQPLNLVTNTFMGLPDKGFNEHSDCINALSEDNRACSPDGNGYLLYSIDTPDSSLSNLVFDTTKSCLEYSKRAVKKISKSSLTPDELLFPFNDVPNTKGYIKTNCQDPSHDYFWTKTADNGELLEDCLPDTLYSWGGFSKAESFRERFANSLNSGTLDRKLYLTASPLSTFGYGPVALRIKLKEGVKGRLVFGYHELNCNDYSPAVKSNNVFVHQWENLTGGAGLDYTICSMNVVDSWSYGTKENYDEIIREHAWVNTHDFKDYELYFKQKGVDQLWDFSVDSHVFSKSNFFSNLRIFRDLINQNIGGVFPLDRPDSIKDHFKTSNPSYFNAD